MFQIKSKSNTVKTRQHSRAEWSLMIAMVALVFAGTFITIRTWNRKIEQKHREITSLAMSIEEALNGEVVRQLNGVPTDINTAAYHSVKNRLMVIRNELVEPEFIYIYTERAGRLYFMVDSEPEDSEDCSPAGQWYEEANEECFVPVKEGRTIITEPAEDRWGSWISVLVPMRNQITGEIYAVFGIDYPANGWYNEALQSTMLTGGIILLLFFFLIALLVILRKNSKLSAKTESQRIVEEKLREREVNFRTFFESMTDMIYICDLQGYILFMNPEIPSKLNHSYDDLVGSRLTMMFAPDVSGEVYLTFLSVLAGKTDHIPSPMCRKDGSLIYVDNKMWFGKWNGKDCVFGVSKDLSKERELLTKFNKFFDSNPALMAVSRLHDGIITEVNQSFINVLGYSHEEVIGRPVRDIRLFTDEIIATQVMQQLLRKRSIRNAEMEILTKDGRKLMGLFSIEIIESDGEQYMLAVMVDITEQKAAEEKAIAASRSKSEFLANMSHEIRTPLNAVIGFAELLQVMPLDETQRQYAKHINVSGKALLGIINDILDFSKIEAGRLELEMIETDMIELFEQSADIIKYHAAQKGLELLLDIEPGIPRMAKADPIRLKQIILNLMNNAVKFTSEGEVELRVTYKAQTSTRGTYICSVRDTGIGISDTQKERLFKAFSQADSSTTRKYGGTGLGLIISHLLAEKMGGCICVESSPGAGSIFKLGFTTEVYPDRTGQQKLSIRNVLIVDDNENNRTILEHTMQYWGLDCDTAANGALAIELVKAKAYDLMLIDYNMPDMDGLETVRQLKKKCKIDQETPVILLHSSSDSVELREKAKKLGVRHSLIKPVKSSELYQYLCSIDVNENTVQPTPDQDLQQQKQVLHGQPNIVIAEDVMVNRLLLKSVIMNQIPNARIFEAVNGEEAVNFIVSHSIDLVFMDIQMPVMDGLEATRRIRRILNGNADKLPVVALTAGALQEEKEKALENGMDDFLTKPIDQEKLREVLKKYLG